MPAKKKLFSFLPLFLFSDLFIFLVRTRLLSLFISPLKHPIIHIRLSCLALLLPPYLQVELREKRWLCWSMLRFRKAPLCCNQRNLIVIASTFCGWNTRKGDRLLTNLSQIEIFRLYFLEFCKC